MTTVLIVDDQTLQRLGFRMLLEAAARLSVVGEATQGHEAVRLTAELRPDVVLMDVRMPGVDGIEATRRIVESGGRSRVLVLTTFDLDEYAYEALRAGAAGFLLKDALPDELSAASGPWRTATRDRPGLTRKLIDAFSAHLPGPAPRPGQPTGRPDRTRTRSPRRRCHGMVQHRDRRPFSLAESSEVPRQPHPGKDRRPRPGTGRHFRL